MTAHGLSRPLFEFAGDAVRIFPALRAKTGGFGQALPQQTVGVLVRAALPGGRVLAGDDRPRTGPAPWSACRRRGRRKGVQ